MMRWMIYCIVACSLAASIATGIAVMAGTATTARAAGNTGAAGNAQAPGNAGNAGNAGVQKDDGVQQVQGVHEVQAQQARQVREGHATPGPATSHVKHKHRAHSSLSCGSCHQRGGKFSDPASRENRAAACVTCHVGYQIIFDRPMGTRDRERHFVERSYAKMDGAFFGKNCSSCHVGGCLDCHGDAHAVSKPGNEACQSCHKGYYTGWDFSGRAPREDNMRYQRGVAVKGETFLKMLPDVHHQAGMTCGDCHSMASLLRGGKSSRACLDCHKLNKKIIEHRIIAHISRLECYACHSAWSAQEYGTFFLRFRDQKLKEDFDLMPGASADYLRSAYLKTQDAPPLGVNAAGRLSPIRPQFIAYYTDIQAARDGGAENSLLAAEWKAFFPHTIQRGTVTCEGCHDNPRRFLLEPPSQRIYRLQQDSMQLESFWAQEGQRVVNGSFMEASRYLRMSGKGPAYTRAYIEKWKTFLNRVDVSSRP